MPVLLVCTVYESHGVPISFWLRVWSEWWGGAWRPSCWMWHKTTADYKQEKIQGDSVRSTLQHSLPDRVGNLIPITKWLHFWWFYHSVQVLVLAPTRELAIQVARDFKDVTKKLTVACFYGGTPYNGQSKYMFRSRFDICCYFMRIIQGIKLAIFLKVSLQ